MGYVSELGLRDAGRTFQRQVDTLVAQASEGSLDFLVVAGGISNNYLITLRFIDEVGRQLSLQGNTVLRFVAGNTDFYYRDSVVDKEKKFNEIRAEYRNCRYYLPTHPIIKHDMRVVGAETWYDYSLYRGKPKRLRDITKKSIGVLKNPDVEYITDAEDYTLGLENIFDMRYSKQCEHDMISELERLYKKCGRCVPNICVQYFYPSQIFLNHGLLEGYFGTFKGSNSYHKLMKDRGVTDCIFGVQSDRKSIKYDGISYLNAGKSLRSVTYGENKV